MRTTTPTYGLKRAYDAKVQVLSKPPGEEGDDENRIAISNTDFQALSKQNEEAQEVNYITMH
jgi:hypothetical protein